MKFLRCFFWFLLLVPVVVLVYEIRTTLIDMREAQTELFLLNAQRASNQRTIMGLQARILHYAEGHEEEHPFGGCPLCFKNMLMEKYDHELIRRFLRENGVSVQGYMDGELSKKDLDILMGQDNGA